MGLYNFVRGFRRAYKRRDLYPGGEGGEGGGVLITGIKKKRLETSDSSVDGNEFFMYWF